MLKYVCLHSHGSNWAANFVRQGLWKAKSFGGLMQGWCACLLPATATSCCTAVQLATGASMANLHQAQCNLPLFPGYNRVRHLLVTYVPLGLGIPDGEKAMRVLLQYSHRLSHTMKEPWRLHATNTCNKQTSSKAASCQYVTYCVICGWPQLQPNAYSHQQIWRQTWRPAYIMLSPSFESFFTRLTSCDTLT